MLIAIPVLFSDILLKWSPGGYTTSKDSSGPTASKDPSKAGASKDTHRASVSKDPRGCIMERNTGRKDTFRYAKMAIPYNNCFMMFVYRDLGTSWLAEQQNTQSKTRKGTWLINCPIFLTQKWRNKTKGTCSFAWRRRWNTANKTSANILFFMLTLFWVY